VREGLRLRDMADQIFVIGYRSVEKFGFLKVHASSVTQEGSHWRISGDKGTLFVSAEAFIYAFPEGMHEQEKKKA
jgi:hypothetical protein